MLKNLKKIINKIVKSAFIFTLIFAWLFQIPLSSNTQNWFQFRGFPSSPSYAEAAFATISYVGTATSSANSTTTTRIDISLSGLSLQQGDLVLVANGWSVFGDGDPGIHASSTGYTEVADLYANDTNDINFSINYKLMGSSPDSSVVCNAYGTVNYGSFCAVYVLRGVNQSTPLDVTSTTSSDINTNVFNSPTITPVTSGAVVISTGGSTNDSATGDGDITGPTGYSNVVSVGGSGASDGSQGGFAMKAWTSGAEDPGVWSNITTGTLTRESWAAATLAIRPATNPEVPVFFDSDGINQIAFNNIRQATSSPLFRASALSPASSTKFQIELNRTSDFSSTSYTQTFTGTYASGTASNFYATNTSPALATTTGTTYYVRARASIDGINYSSWSTSTRSFTYITSGNTDWFQTQKAQFDTGTLTGVTASSTTHAVHLNTGSSTGNIISATSTFSNFIGVNSWSTASWSTTESGGTTSLQVYYATSSTCTTLVPNSALAGNSTGFASTSSPLSLSGLSTTTYPTLCLKATLATTTGAVSLSLNDWTISATNIVSVTAQNTQVNYRWRNDDSLESAATYAAATSTALSSGVYVGDRKRLRIQVSNTASSITNYRYRLEYASNNDSCASWTTVPQSTTTGPWSMDWSYYFSDGAQTTDSSGIANPAGKTFVTGYIMSYLNQTPNISLASSSFTEVEYSLRSTSNVTPSLVYCFRVTDAGTSSVFVYSNQPQITVSVLPTNTRTGGSNTESSGTPGANQTGGSRGGGSGSEGSGSGTPTSTSTPSKSGGGGDVGLLQNINGFMFATVALSGEWTTSIWNFIKKLFSSIFRD